MNYLKSTLLVIALLFSAFSCNVLDVEPQNSIPADEAFKDKAGIERGIFGAYSTLQYFGYYGRTYGIFSDLAADNLAQPIDGTASEYREVDNNNILPENGSVAGIWSACYDGINVANNVIEKVPAMSDMSAEEKNRALGELYFIRALDHFNALNYFGAVPIKITPTIGVDDLNVPRNSVDQVYAQIISDLTFAAEHLPASTSQKIRATKYAAVGLLARVYLYKKDYAMAADMAGKVISEGGYTLLDDYAAIFDGDGSAETIFEVDFTTLDRNRIAEYNFPKTLNGRREVEPTQSVLDAYEIGDERYNASIAFDAALAYPIKYDDLSTGADNFIVIRLGEMYLIRAEAEARNNGDIGMIKDDIDEIRLRANLSETSASTYPALLLQIEKDRRIELAFEGHRWFDLVRTGRAIEVLPNVNSTNQTLFPIPSSELQTNTNSGMTQNPGY
ncbi:RagB/SusD family nutrient uptake outer membrane protein [Cryomorpha ignava]|uniref:RagB/SusD family nutrient uptake outer membrane protein n=1 Tax=Cryomorpha ignava TaxID=101383 RepID=UPI001EF99196|nr:RagB/SusD family nutrient uptake outer membrane protein [Cryomorpha ignava]